MFPKPPLAGDRSGSRLCKNDGPIGHEAKNGQESPSWKESAQLRRIDCFRINLYEAVVLFLHIYGPIPFCKTKLL